MNPKFRIIKQTRANDKEYFYPQINKERFLSKWRYFAVNGYFIYMNGKDAYETISEALQAIENYKIIKSGKRVKSETIIDVD